MSAPIATIRPARNLQGSLRLPGDKSVSHRYAMLAAIAEGKTRLENYASGADCAATLACVRALGCEVTQQESQVLIEGRGPRLAQPRAALDCGNSGSTMRMLAGILAGQPFESKLAGDASLSQRPMERVAEPLRAMGARISSSPGGRPPLRIQGGGLHAIHYTLPVPSAQVKSAVLFAGLFARGDTTVEEPVLTRDHSELALRAFGVSVVRSRVPESAARLATIRGGQRLKAVEAVIPGDLSSAAFFCCAAALFPGSNLVLDNLLLNPTRAALFDVLASMGVSISFLQVEERLGELAGTVTVRGGSLGGARISGTRTATLVDELPVLAAIAPYTREGIDIRDAGELRVKESDRITLLVRNLRAMGAQVEEFPDGLRVPGEQRLQGADIHPAGDHRIAMAFAIAALRAEGETRIHEAGCAAVSYPAFFFHLESLLER